MSPSGHVLDLLDRRCFQDDLQDVFGHVAPFPTLVPYDQYGFMPAVYRIKTNHEDFMRQLQDLTDFHAGFTRKELWTWWVQWEVVPSSNLLEPPSAKKPRLDSLSKAPGPSLNDVKSTPKPVHKDTGRRALGWELFKSDDMHRILADILTVQSEILPNYVEFLYQWIDYHLGDGKALHAAVNHEIPSLWLYEDHPRPLGEGERVGDHEGRHLQEAAAAIKKGNNRKKPDLSELERQTEQSERMQYHEVKFGLQRPIDPEHGLFTPILNIPDDEGLRSKYYAACFKNRQRALWLLQEAGVSAKKIANYKLGQKEAVLETREDREGNGFKEYYHDLPYANENRAFKEHMMRLREKQKEIALSNQLAEEARQAALNADSRSSALALMPPESSQLSREACDKMTEQLFENLIATAFKIVPGAICGNLKSKLFANSKPDRSSAELNTNGDEDSGSDYGSLEDDEEADDDDNDTDDDDDNDENLDPMDDSAPIPALPALSNSSSMNPTAPTTGHHFVGSYYASVFPEVTGSSEDINEWRPPSLFEMGPHSLRPTQSNPTLHIQPPSPVMMDYENLGGATQYSPSPFQQSAGPTMYQQVQPSPISSNPAPTLHHQSVNPFAPTTGSQNSGPVQPHPSPFLSTLAAPCPSAQGFSTQSNPTSVLSTPSPNPFLPPPNPFGNPVSTSSGPGINPFQSTTFNGTLHQPQGYTPSTVFSNTTGPQNPPGNNPFLTASPSSTLSQSTVRAPRPAPLNLLGVHTNQVFNPFQGNRAVSSSQLMTPLANLAGGLTLASPAAPPLPDVPIFIYFPKIVLSQNEIIPTPATDCLLIGHSPPRSRGIVLTKAVFLPAHISKTIAERARKGEFIAIETYPPPLDHPAAPPLPINHEPRTIANTPDDIHGAHRHLYGKVLQAYNIMTQCGDRENDLTKRWRISRGPMTKRDRGSIWEGWGVYVDRGIEMLEHERIGAAKLARIHPPNMDDPEEAYEEMRRREIEEMIEEDEKEQEALTAAEQEQRRIAEEENMLAYMATGDLAMLED